MSDTINKPHELLLHDRKTVSLTGVTEVKSFDDSEVTLDTVCGELTVDGEGLRISSLDTTHGTLDINGNIQGFSYYDKKKDGKRTIFGKVRG